MHAVLGAADGRGEPLVALLGNPDFYAKFGFETSTEYDITAPDPAWGHFFQVRPLTAFGSETAGEFRYAEPFSQLEE